MRRLSTRLAIAVFIVTVSPAAVNSVPAPADPNRGWVDFDNLTQQDRLKERPGNFQALAAVARFYDGLYRVRPDFTGCAYPFVLGPDVVRGGGRFTNRTQAEDFLDGLAAQRSPRENRRRQYNMNVRSLIMHDAGTVPETPELWNELFSDTKETFRSVRRDHPGRAIVAIATIDLLSLQSPKIEDGMPVLFYLVFKDGDWKVAWYEEGGMKKRVR